MVQLVVLTDEFDKIQPHTDIWERKGLKDPQEGLTDLQRLQATWELGTSRLLKSWRRLTEAGFSHHLSFAVFLFPSLSALLSSFSTLDTSYLKVSSTWEAALTQHYQITKQSFAKTKLAIFLEYPLLWTSPGNSCWPQAAYSKSNHANIGYVFFHQ